MHKLYPFNKDLLKNSAELTSCMSGCLAIIEHLVGAGQANARQRGEVVTAGHDAHVAELLKGVALGRDLHHLVEATLLY